MASIANPSVWPLKLPTGHVVPDRGSLETTNDIIRCPDNWPTLQGLSLSGQIGLTFDPEPDLTAEAAAPQEPVAAPVEAAPEVPKTNLKGA